MTTDILDRNIALNKQLNNLSGRYEMIRAQYEADPANTKLAGELSFLATKITDTANELWDRLYPQKPKKSFLKRIFNR